MNLIPQGGETMYTDINVKHKKPELEKKKSNQIQTATQSEKKRQLLIPNYFSFIYTIYPKLHVNSGVTISNSF